MWSLKTGLIGASAFGLTSIAAQAVEFCVTCEGPSARYNCAFADPAATAGDARLKLFCITELAKAGSHASCAVDRKSTRCDGVVKAFSVPDGMAMPSPAAAPAAAPAPKPASAGGEPKPAPAPAAVAVPPGTTTPNSDAPPKTVKELVEKGNASTAKTLEKTGESAAEAAKSTGTVIEKTGKAVGDAAKKTWKCITTLFGDC